MGARGFDGTVDARNGTRGFDAAEDGGEGWIGGLDGGEDWEREVSTERRMRGCGREFPTGAGEEIGGERPRRSGGCEDRVRTGPRGSDAE